MIPHSQITEVPSSRRHDLDWLSAFPPTSIPRIGGGGMDDLAALLDVAMLAFMPACAATFRIVIMDQTTYGRAYETAFDADAALQVLSKEALEQEFLLFDARLREALSRCYVEEDDYQVSWEWQGTFHHCGGVYSARAYHADLVRAIVDVISTLPHAENWTYHTACESDLWDGEFFIRNQTLYVPKDGNDYAGCFGFPGVQVERVQGDDPMITMREAVIDGDCHLVATLIRSNSALVKTRDDLKETPLHHAVEHSNTEMVELLLRNHAATDAQNMFGATPLHAACGRGASLDVLRALLHANADVNSATEDGETPLHVAAFHGQAGAARLLLDAGANVDGVELAKKCSPLVSAAMFDHAEVAVLLVERGAAVNRKGDGSVAPLLTAAQHGSARVCRLLLSAGADPNVHDKDGKTALYLACEQGKSFDTIQALVAAGANVNLVVEGRTALWKAVGISDATISAEAVRLLLEAGAHVENAVPGLNGPLHMAAMKGHVDVARLLVQWGAKVNSKGYHDYTPLHFAAQSDFDHVCEFLLASGADPDTASISGETPLEMSAGSGSGKAYAVLKAWA